MWGLFWIGAPFQGGIVGLGGALGKVWGILIRYAALLEARCLGHGTSYLDLMMVLPIATGYYSLRLNSRAKKWARCWANEFSIHYPSPTPTSIHPSNECLLSTYCAGIVLSSREIEVGLPNHYPPQTSSVYFEKEEKIGYRWHTSYTSVNNFS